MAYLPPKKIAMVVTTTLGPKALTQHPIQHQIMAAIGNYLVPDQPLFR